MKLTRSKTTPSNETYTFKTTPSNETYTFKTTSSNETYTFKTTSSNETYVQKQHQVMKLTRSKTTPSNETYTFKTTSSNENTFKNNTNNETYTFKKTKSSNETYTFKKTKSSNETYTFKNNTSNETYTKTFNDYQRTTLDEARDEHMKKIRELEEEIRTQRNESGNCKMVNHDIGTQTDTPGNNSWISLSELPDDTSNCKQLNNLRQQYLTITAQMKDDLMKHALETRNNAARAIRCEVAKERHSTAKQLRKHYLECLKQILEEDKQSYQNDRPTKTNDEKMNMMAERLCLPGEKNETKCSHESTLTNVTTLNETTSKDHELHHSSDHKRFFSKTSRYLQPNDVTSNVSSKRPKRNEAKKGGENEVNEVSKNPRDSGKHKLQSSVVQDVGISYFESSSLSFESLDIDLPPVIDLEVQSSSDDIKNDTMARIDSLERHVTDKNTHDTKNVRQKTQFGERNTISTDRETHSIRHDKNPTSPEIRKIFINEEDEGFNATTSDDKMTTQLPIRSTNSRQKTKEIQTHEQHTRSNEKRKQKYISWQETQNNRDVTQVKAGRPVTYESSSKNIPSTQSTAASHASRVFSYTMHSNKNR
ncbi:uncharacterized protein LOC124452263 [Xenia sp. Carnegie-2017]|uniref:uncharacterized protein LOC124452263 n=1 Tax=Xenia sp. Carnegie-2017 TaxID=2897299 RepID=UPI001F04FB7E|nr:uncharacterized protein LOC124452263 [Xenia sp. Carnegie-2017]